MPRLTKLKLTRIERERAQIEVAFAARINPTRMNRLENGWVQPTSDELRRIAEVLGTSTHAGDWVTDTFARFGIRIEPCPKNRSELYLELLPMITTGKVELLDDRRLLGQLLNLERRTGRLRDVVDHPSGSGHHDDAINSAAGALVAAKGSAGWIVDLSINDSFFKLSEWREYR